MFAVGDTFSYTLSFIFKNSRFTGSWCICIYVFLYLYLCISILQDLPSPRLLGLDTGNPAADGEAEMWIMALIGEHDLILYDISGLSFFSSKNNYGRSRNIYYHISNFVFKEFLLLRYLSLFSTLPLASESVEAPTMKRRRRLKSSNSHKKVLKRRCSIPDAAKADLK